MRAGYGQFTSCVLLRSKVCVSVLVCCSSVVFSRRLLNPSKESRSQIAIMPMVSENKDLLTGTVNMPIVLL